MSPVTSMLLNSVVSSHLISQEYCFLFLILRPKWQHIPYPFYLHF
jgi:hypothetical protein